MIAQKHTHTQSQDIHLFFTPETDPVRVEAFRVELLCLPNNTKPCDLLPAAVRRDSDLNQAKVALNITT